MRRGDGNDRPTFDFVCAILGKVRPHRGVRLVDEGAMPVRGEHLRIEPGSCPEILDVCPFREPRESHSLELRSRPSVVSRSLNDVVVLLAGVHARCLTRNYYV